MSELILPGEGFGKSVHGLDDRLIGARLLGWMTLEANGANWWVCGLLKDGKVIAWDSTAQATNKVLRLPLPLDRQHFAVRALSGLVEIGEGGTWLCAWFDNGKRFYMLWKDEDGDIQIPIEVDVGWVRLREWSAGDLVRLASQSFKTWAEIHKNMEYRKGQQIKLAKGEKSIDPTIH